jgi:hypothetical protein
MKSLVLRSSSLLPRDGKEYGNWAPLFRKRESHFLFGRNNFKRKSNKKVLAV